MARNDEIHTKILLSIIASFSLFFLCVDILHANTISLLSPLGDNIFSSYTTRLSIFASQNIFKELFIL